MNKIRRIDSFFEKKYIDNSIQHTERVFSAMKIVKIRLRNRMKDDFLANYLIVYIEKEIAERFTINMIMMISIL
jgi:hypothetical protein